MSASAKFRAVGPSLRYMRRLFVGLWCVFYGSHSVAAEEVCYQFRLGSSMPWVEQSAIPGQVSTFCQNGAAANFTTSCTSGFTRAKSSYSCTFTPTGSVVGSGSNWSITVQTFCSAGPGFENTWNVNLSVTRRVNPDGCPDDPCEDAQSLAQAGVAAGANVEQSGQMCSADDGSGGMYSGGLYGKGCEVVRDGAGISSSDGAHWYGQIKYTGQSCPASPTPQELDSKANCISVAGGRVCVSKQEKSCGTFDGQAVCLDDVPEGDCLLLSAGGAVCTAGAAGVPRDEMGDPLPPSSTVTGTSGASSGSGGTTTNYNYYSASVVNSSASGASGQESGGGGGAGDGDGDDVEACTTDEDCFGDLPSDSCADDLVGCIGDAVSGVYDSFGATPLISSVTGLYGAFAESGACVAVPVPLFGEDYDVMSPVCSLLSDNSSLLELLFMVAWSIGGLRILMGGGE